ncbi:hypothetical protein LSAT2_008380 [Lamellibrachia satsuma]|nr:hypothetical protein LSAT2_008380 [Lamellibrachia satsuma]
MTHSGTSQLRSMESFRDLDVTNLWFELLNGYNDRRLHLLLQTIQRKYTDLYSGPGSTVPLPGRPTLRRLVILLEAVAKHQRTLSIGIITCDLIRRLVSSEYALQELVVKGLPEALLMTVRSLSDDTQDGLTSTSVMLLRFQLLEASTKLLLHLCCATRQNSALLDVLLTENAATAMLDLIDCEKSIVFQHSPEASRQLETLTCGKTLIGQRVRLDNGVLRNKYRHYFGNNRDAVVLPSIGYTVTLFDTTDPDEDVVISREMLNSKLVWPEDESESVITRPNTDWVDVSVQCAFGGTWFWAQFPDKDPVAQMGSVDAALQGFYLKNSSLTLKHAPMAGAFVCGERPGIGIYRAQVVSASNTTAMVFAFDHGSLFEAPWKKLVCITQELDLKVVPQAMLCQLQGVRPAAYSVSLVADAIAVVCNLSSHVKATMLKMPRCVCLVPLCCCPCPLLTVYTFQLLSNLAWDQCQRVILATPFIKVILAICRRLVDKLREPEMSGVVEAALALLNNLIYDCPENLHKLGKMEGLEVLLTLTADSTPFAVREAALKVMRCYVGDGQASPSITGSKSRLRRRPKSGQHSYQSDNEGSLRRGGRSSHRDVHTSPESDGDMSRRWRSRQYDRNDSRGLSASKLQHGGDGRIRVVARFNYQDSSSDDGFRSNNHGAPDSILSSLPDGARQSDEGPAKTQFVNMAELRSSDTRYYVKDDIVSIIDDETHEIRSSGRLEDVSASCIANIVCSFLNTGKGGTVYFGLRKSSALTGSRVNGINASRDQRDCFRMGVDKEVMGTIMPVVTAMYYDIIFSPIVRPEPTLEQATVLPDLFVIEVHLKPIVGSAFVTNTKYYVREGDKSVCLHTQQKIHERLIKMQEELYLKELASLSLEMEHLRKLAACRNSANQTSSKPVTSTNQCWSSGPLPPDSSRVEE